jgi:hypothetical protein
MKGKKLSHDIIIRALTDALKPLDYIHAFWEGGAIAFNRVDEWSDIDVYLVVDDDNVDQAFLDVERALRSLSPIKQKYDVPSLSIRASLRHSTDCETPASILLLILQS